MVKSLLSLVFLAGGIAGIGFLIVFHEFGHFIFGKMFGMRIPTFSMGFGPRLLTKKFGETEFTLSAIPLGGYVDLGTPEGMADDERSFIKRPYYQKFFVILGGIGFNLLFAYIAFTLLFMAGMPATRFLYPENATTTIEQVEKESAAEKSGLMVDDVVKSINNTPITKISDFYEIIKPLAGQTASLTIEREGNDRVIDVEIGSRTVLGQTFGSIGLLFKMAPLPSLSVRQAFLRGIKLTNQFIAGTFYAFKNLIASRDTSEIAGPLMLFSGSVKFASQGIKVFLIFLAIISVNLAVLNLIPLPVFDGGRLFMYTIEAIIRRPLPERVQEYIFLATWVALIGLTLYMLKQDVVRMFWSK